MKLTTAAVSAAAAVYLVFCVFYSAKVVHSSAAAPPPLMSHRSIRPLGVIAAAVERTRGADAVMATTSSSDSRLSVPNIPQQAGQKPDAAAIASWCARMQREGDAIARSFDGNAGKNECWGEKGSRTFLSRFISLQNQLATAASSAPSPRVIIDVGCNKGDYIAELSPLLRQGGSAGMPAVSVHAFEAMPQNCEFIEKLPLVVEMGTRVRLHCAALGDSDGSVVFESNGLVGDEGAKMHASGAAAASNAGYSKTVTVPLRRLDSFVSEIQKDGSVILLKVDAEGAEGRIFTGAHRLLEAVDLVLFEVGEPWYRTPSVWNVRDAAMFWARNEFLAFRLGVDKLFRFDGAFYRSTHDADGNVYWGNAIAIRRNSPLLPRLLALYNNIPPDVLLPGSDWSSFSSLQETCLPAAVPDPCVWHPNVPEDAAACSKTGWQPFH